MTPKERIAEIRKVVAREQWDHYDYEKLAHSVPQLLDALEKAVEALERVGAAYYLDGLGWGDGLKPLGARCIGKENSPHEVSRATLSQIEKLLGGME